MADEVLVLNLLTKEGDKGLLHLNFNTPTQSYHQIYEPLMIYGMHMWWPLTMPSGTKSCNFSIAYKIKQKSSKNHTSTSKIQSSTHSQ